MSRLLQLEHFLAPWQSAYSNSRMLSTTVAVVHVASLLFGGGFAIAADRLTLRAWGAGIDERARQLAELHAVHRPVLIALCFSFLSGVLLAAADVKTFANSPAFWIKLGFVALLVLNGAVLNATEFSLRRTHAISDRAKPANDAEPLWSRLRAFALCSVALWTATVIAGVVLQNAS
ncbi:MAG TPA: hypothetical protein VK617_09115 [Gemmatimonadaceae bacterium]|nr:hypothetical protein [Gemmatimonadaceae bacterium]